MSQENVRVQRTRTLLRQALVELIEERGFERVTVGEITDDLVPTLLGGMFLQSITWWLDMGRPLSPREIAGRTAGLASALIAEAQAQNGATTPPPSRLGPNILGDQPQRPS